jgi:hypothetical protein
MIYLEVKYLIPHGYGSLKSGRINFVAERKK